MYSRRTCPANSEFEKSRQRFSRRPTKIVSWDHNPRCSHRHSMIPFFSTTIPSITTALIPCQTNQPYTATIKVVLLEEERRRQFFPSARRKTRRRQEAPRLRRPRLLRVIWSKSFLYKLRNILSLLQSLLILFVITVIWGALVTLHCRLRLLSTTITRSTTATAAQVATTTVQWL